MSVERILNFMLQDPTDWELHCRLGEQYEREEKFDEAISAFWNGVSHAPQLEKHQAYRFALNAVRRLPAEALEQLVTFHEDPSEVPNTSVVVTLPVWYAIAENIYSDRSGKLEHFKKHFKQNRTIYLGTVFNADNGIIVHEKGTRYSMRFPLRLPDREAHDLEELTKRKEWGRHLEYLFMPSERGKIKDVLNVLAEYQLLNTHYKDVKVQIGACFHTRSTVRGLIHINDTHVIISCKPYENDGSIYALQVE